MTFLLVGMVVGYGTLFGALVLWIGRVGEEVEEPRMGSMRQSVLSARRRNGWFSLNVIRPSTPDSEIDGRDGGLASPRIRQIETSRYVADRVLLSLQLYLADQESFMRLTDTVR